MNYYIGLACTLHDPAIAILDSDGKVLFAEATERPLQYKRCHFVAPDLHPHLFPLIREHCQDATRVVIAKTWGKRYYLTSGWFSVLAGQMARLSARWAPVLDCVRLISLGQRHVIALAGERSRYHIMHGILGPMINRQQTGALDSVDADLPSGRPVRVRVRYFNHHLTHAATACYTAPFSEAACAVIDGYGELTSMQFYSFRKGLITPLRHRRSLGSAGVFYACLCAACGFDPIAGEEWKVMGLAPFGKLDKRAYELMKEMLQVNGLSLRTTAKLFDPRLWRFLSTIDREGLAFTGQQVFEETVLALLRNLRERTRMDCLVYGGGCALNSACNGKIVASTGFHKVHVYAAPADDGNALGAAFLAVKADGGQPDRMTRPLTPFLGSTVSRESLEKLKNFSHKGRVREVGDSIAEVAARAIAQGKVVGWMQGRAEFGPRALGNRSILADPRNDHIKAYLNSQVKSRESFRPFAPAILHGHGNEYFEDYQESPYMERVLKFRAGVITKVPGVVHVDGTGRAQSVFEWMNPAFHALLEQFHQIAGVPVLLNTSLNVMGKPIAHSLEDVLPLLYTTGLHALAIEGLWVEKPEGID